MRSFPTALGIVLLAVLAACSTPGCGGKKRGPLTIAQRLERARAEPTDEGRARELTKVARLQVRSLDRSGARTTLSEARGLLTPKAPKPVPPPLESPAGDAEPAGEAAPAEPAADGAPAAEEPAPAADTGTVPTPDAAATTEEGVPAEAAVPEAAPAEPDAAAAVEPPPADAPPAEEPPPPEPARVVNPVLAGPILVEIAGLFAQIGERTTARDVLSQVMKLAEQIDDPVVKATMLAEAGGIYGAKTGGLSEVGKARKALDAAATCTDSIEERFRPQALAAVALGYVEAGLTEQAAEKVGALEELARSAADRPKAEGLAVAARVRAQAGDKEAAKALLDEAASAAKGIVGHENRAYALVSVATATVAAGERKAALALVAEAEKSANKIGDAEAQKEALERVRAQRGDIERRSRK
jgi:tetratricopeptide (TPR) repeat protein